MSDKSLRVLLDPVYTAKSLKRCATWYVLKAVGKRILAEYPNSVLYIPVPPKDDLRWVVDDHLDDPRVIEFEMKQSRDRYKEYLTLKDEWVAKFAFWGEAFDWDVLVTTRTFQVQNIRLLTYKGYTKFISIYEPLPLVKDKKTVTMFKDFRELQLQTLGGYVNADRVAIHAGHEVDSIMREATALLSPAMCRQLQSRVVQKYMAPEGVDLDYPNHKTPRAAGEPLRIVYTQRLDKSERRPDKVFDALRYEFIANSEKYSFGIMTNGAIAEIDKETDKFKKFVDYSQPERSEFYAGLKKAHVCMSWAVEEGVPFSIVEAVSHGVIPIVKREKWSEALLGKDYPWLVDNLAEAVSAIKGIEEDYDKRYAAFLTWYTDVWLPKFKREGDFIDDLILQLNEKFFPQRTAMARPKHGDSLSVLVNNYCDTHGITDFVMHDLLKAMSAEKVTDCNFTQTLENTKHEHVPISRNTSLYETRVELIELFGWRDAPGVGRLVR